DTVGIEIAVKTLRDRPQSRDVILQQALALVTQTWQQGKTPVVYTSRAELTFTDIQQRLEFGKNVSALLMDVVRGLPSEIGFLISKGGITSNDVLSDGLNLTAARLLGQIIPGCSVIRTSPEHPQFPNLPVVLFPGNVGDENSLVTAWQYLRNS
ncbi:MAG TPA: nucleotide-binding domain containing protein, partial [Xenococcaceae cyanobacterium]